MNVVYKAPNEEFDVRFKFINTDNRVSYQVQAILNASIKRDVDGVDMSNEMLVPGRNQAPALDVKARPILNSAAVWIKGGEAGKDYTMEVQVQMDTLQILTETVKVLVRNR